MHPSRIFGFWLVTAFVVLVPMRLDPSSSLTPPELVTLHEAEILIYLLPEAHEVRTQGMEIGWELETSPKLNQSDYYNFWVVNAKRRPAYGSLTIGHFSVNKETADIWNVGMEKFVVTTELEGVQSILRKAHHIDEATIKKYRSRRPHVPPASN